MKQAFKQAALGRKASPPSLRSFNRVSKPLTQRRPLIGLGLRR